MIAGFRFIIHDHVPGEPSHSDPRTHEKRDAPLPNDPNAIVRAEKEPLIRGDPLDQRRVRLHPPPPFHATVICRTRRCRVLVCVARRKEAAAEPSY
jgi:hypothetical protein